MSTDKIKENENDITLTQIILSIKNSIKFLLSKKKFIIGIGIISIVIGIVFATFSTPKFLASVTFFIDNANKGGGQLSGLMNIANQFGGGGGNSDSFSSDNVLEMIKTRNIIQKTLLTSAKVSGKQDLLVNHYIEFKHFREKWKEKPHLLNMKFDSLKTSKLTYSQDSLIGIFHKQLVNNSIDISKIGATELISLNVQTENEDFSKEFAIVLAKAISYYYVFLKTAQARVPVEIIENRVDSIRNTLINRQLELSKWQDSRKFLVKMEGNVDFFKLQREVEILNLMYAESIKQYELSKVNLLNQTPLIQIIDQPILPLTFVRFSKIKGAILGAILGLFFACIYLIVKEKLKSIINEVIEEEKLQKINSSN